MITVVVVVHLILAISLIGSVLLQKSEGGALGMGGGGMTGFMSGRSTANLLTRTTAVLAACFFATSIALAVLAAHNRAPHSIIDLPGAAAPDQAPAPAAGEAPAPSAPAAPSSTAPTPAPAAPEPSAPLAK